MKLLKNNIDLNFLFFLFLKLSHIPDFEGDDLKRLAMEIKKAKEYLRQSITFRLVNT